MSDMTNILVILRNIFYEVKTVYIADCPCVA